MCVIILISKSDRLFEGPFNSKGRDLKRGMRKGSQGRLGLYFKEPARHSTKSDATQTLEKLHQAKSVSFITLRKR